MSLELIRLLFDTGLFVLIWIIQLIVYPSFTFYNQGDLKRWHDIYTERVTFIVMPLMLGQLATIVLQLWVDRTWYTIISGIIVFLLWWSTFLKFVPLHNKIQNGDFNANTLDELIKSNWNRTILWTLLFLISLGKLLYLNSF